MMYNRWHGSDNCRTPYQSAIRGSLMTKKILTQSELTHALHYDPDTGVFTWVNPSKYHAEKKGTEAGWLNDDGYIGIRLNATNYSAHRLAWLYVHGSFPENETDHIDGDRSNNRIDNLRDVTKSVNQRNAKKRSDNKSGICGVHWHKATKKWAAQARVDGKQQHLGLFNCRYKAASVRHFAQEIEGGYTGRHGV